MREQIQQRVHDLTNIPLQDIHIKLRERLEYQNNNLYDVRFDETHWIAKEFVKVDEFTSSPKREYGALNLLKPYDLAPKAIDYLAYPDYEHPIVIYEFMQGEMWDRRKPSQDELKRLAETWLRTHQATRAGLWLSRGWEEPIADQVQRHQWFYTIYFDWAQVHFPEGIPHAKHAFALYETQAETIQKLKNAQPKLFFSRSDPRFANIIARPDGRIGFVDWEDSGLRSPARTLSDLLLHPNQEDLLTDEEWQIFLDVYSTGYPAPEDDLLALIHYHHLLGSLMWFGGLLHFGVRRAEQGTLPNWQINGMPANERLRRYLARCLSWEDNSFETHLANLGDVCFFPLNEL